MRSVGRFLAGVLVLTATGCGESDPLEAERARAEEALRDVAGFDTFDDLMDELRSYGRDVDALALLDLVRVEDAGMAAVMTRRFQRSIARAEIELADALRDAFPDDETIVSRPAVDMAAFAIAMGDAEAVQTSPVAARITLQFADGSSRLLPAERIGRWLLAPEAMSDGEQLDDPWWLAHRSDLFGRLKFTRDTLTAVRAGEFASAAEAAAHLENLMAGPLPRRGEVQPDPDP